MVVMPDTDLGLEAREHASQDAGQPMHCACVHRVHQGRQDGGHDAAAAPGQCAGCAVRQVTQIRHRPLNSAQGGWRHLPGRRRARDTAIVGTPASVATSTSRSGELRAACNTDQPTGGLERMGLERIDIEQKLTQTGLQVLALTSATGGVTGRVPPTP